MKKEFFYLATIVYHNDSCEPNAESGVFTTARKAWNFIKRRKKEFIEDNLDPHNEIDKEIRETNHIFVSISDYRNTFDAHVKPTYMDDPDGIIKEILRKNEKIIKANENK